MGYNLEIYSGGVPQGQLNEYDIVQAIWKEMYYGADELTLTVAYSDNMVDLLKRDNIIVKTDTHRAVVIQSVELSDDINTAQIVVVAYDVKKTLDNRIGYGEWSFSDAEADILAFIENNLRGLEIEVGEPKGYDIEISYTTEWRTVWEMSESALARAGLSGRVRYLDKKFVYDIFQGEDKTKIGDISYSGGTLATSSYLCNNFAEKNVGFVRGENEITEIVGDTTDSPWKKEVIIDMTGYGQERGYTLPNGTTGTKVYTDEEYRAILRTNGAEKLNEYGITEQLVVEMLPTGNLVPGEDFYLGDLLTFVHPTWGIHQPTQCTGLVYIWDKTGKAVGVILQ